jgi:hypothetical protein
MSQIEDEANNLPPTMTLAGDSLAVGLTRAEIDQQIATARLYPRSLQRVTANILTLATLDEETAAECLYALPRGGKPIKGPSIRFAEIIKQCWGNCRSASRVVQVADSYVEAEGIFHDLETNSATAARIRRRITDKDGRRYSEDMIIVTGNAACSIALRNGILGGIPKPVWRKAYEAIHQVVAGDIATLAEARENSLRAFAQFGVTPQQVFVALGVVGDADITLEHIPVLRGMYSALRNGEATVEEMFVPVRIGNGNGQRQTLSSALDNLAAGGGAKPANDASPAEPADEQAILAQIPSLNSMGDCLHMAQEVTKLNLASDALGRINTALMKRQSDIVKAGQNTDGEGRPVNPRPNDRSSKARAAHRAAPASAMAAG